jgi:hypothetical protein
MRLGDVGHRLEIGHAAMIEPVEDLLGAQLRLLGVQPRRFQLRADLLPRQAEQVDAPILARGDGARHGHGVDMSGDLHGGAI